MSIELVTDEKAKMPNDCAECAAFDAETRKRMHELFGPEEVTLMIFNLAGYLQNIMRLLKGEKIVGIQRLQLTQQRDMCGMTLGKFMVALSPESHEKMLEAVKTNIGIELNVKSERCPHQGQEKVNENQADNQG